MARRVSLVLGTLQVFLQSPWTRRHTLCSLEHMLKACVVVESSEVESSPKPTKAEAGPEIVGSEGDGNTWWRVEKFLQDIAFFRRGSGRGFWELGSSTKKDKAIPKCIILLFSCSCGPLNTYGIPAGIVFPVGMMKTATDGQSVGWKKNLGLVRECNHFMCKGIVTAGTDGTNHHIDSNLLMEISSSSMSFRQNLNFALYWFSWRGVLLYCFGMRLSNPPRCSAMKRGPHGPVFRWAFHSYRQNRKESWAGTSNQVRRKRNQKTTLHFVNLRGYGAQKHE